MSPDFVLGRFAIDRSEPIYGLMADEMVYPLSELGVSDGSPFDDWDEVVDAGRELVARIRGGQTVAGRRLADVRVAAPVQPGQVFQSGANYRTHVIQLRVAHARHKDPAGDVAAIEREAAELMDRRAAEDTPYVFIGLPSAICGPYDDVVLPSADGQHDWELELAVVIGRRAYRVDRVHAMDHVAGYTICNDLTTRDRVFRPDLPSIGTDWLASKNAPTFLPTGPYVVPSAFVPDPNGLRIELRLNGEAMQDESTSDMIFNIPRLIEHVSSIAPLLAGDLLLTGSPAGNGIHHDRLLRPGDMLEGRITGLGHQRNRCVQMGQP